MNFNDLWISIWTAANAHSKYQFCNFNSVELNEIRWNRGWILIYFALHRWRWRRPSVTKNKLLIIQWISNRPMYDSNTGQRQTCSNEIFTLDICKKKNKKKQIGPFLLLSPLHPIRTSIVRISNFNASKEWITGLCLHECVFRKAFTANRKAFHFNVGFMSDFPLEFIWMWMTECGRWMDK